MNAHSSPIALVDEAPDRALGDHRGAVRHREAHRVRRRRASASSPCLVATRTPSSRIVAQHVLVLRAGTALGEGQVVRHRSGSDRAAPAVAAMALVRDRIAWQSSGILSPDVNFEDRLIGSLEEMTRTVDAPQGARLPDRADVRLVRPDPPRPREVPRAGQGARRRARRRRRQRREDPPSQGRGPPDGPAGRAPGAARPPAPGRPDLPEGRRRGALGADQGGRARRAGAHRGPLLQRRGAAGAAGVLRPRSRCSSARRR